MEQENKKTIGEDSSIETREEDNQKGSKKKVVILTGILFLITISIGCVFLIKQSQSSSKEDISIENRTLKERVVVEEKKEEETQEYNQKKWEEKEILQDINLRKEPTAKSEKIMTIYEGDFVEVLENVTNESGYVWYKVRYSGTHGSGVYPKEGWIHSVGFEKARKNIIEITDTSKLYTIASEEAKYVNVIGKVAVPKRGIDGRRGPGDDYGIEGTILEKYNFHIIAVVRYAGEVWFKIKGTMHGDGSGLPFDGEAWMLANDMIIKDNPNYVPKYTETKTEETIILPILKNMNIRSGPGTEYEKIGIKKNGESITLNTYAVNQTGETWIKINYNGKVGWINVDVMLDELMQYKAEQENQQNKAKQEYKASQRQLAEEIKKAQKQMEEQQKRVEEEIQKMKKYQQQEKERQGNMREQCVAQRNQQKPQMMKQQEQYISEYMRLRGYAAGGGGYFNDRMNAFSEEYDAKTIQVCIGLNFCGYTCTNDCSGHIAGYEWARQKGITYKSNCSGNSQSFIEGCWAYVEGCEP